MDWRRFGMVLWIVGGLTAVAAGIEWNSKASYNQTVEAGTNMFMTVEKPLGIYPALTIIGAVMAVVGFAVMMASPQREKDPASPKADGVQPSR